MKTILCILLLTLISCKINFSQKFIGDYLGFQSPPESPEIFAPNLVSTTYGEFAGAFSPDYNEYYFTRRGEGPNHANAKIMQMLKDNGNWTDPAVAPFALTQYYEFEPYITPDGNILYFGSRRPIDDNDISGRMRQWFVEKTDKGWSQPQVIGEPLTNRMVMYPSVANDGTFYFTGEEGVYFSEYDGVNFSEPIKMSDRINKYPLTAHPFIDPEEKFLIFDAQERGTGKTDIFISYKRFDGSWTNGKKPHHNINAGNSQAMGYIAPGGDAFFFTRNADIYWVKADIIFESRLKPILEIDKNSGHFPLIVNFEPDLTSVPDSIINIFWDFDSDGDFEIENLQPQFEYDSPGLYSVTVKVITESDTALFRYENIINVFDGNSALEFNGESSSVIFENNPIFNLTQNFSIEMAIKPSELLNQKEGNSTIFDNSVISVAYNHNGFNLIPKNCCLIQIKKADSSIAVFHTPENSFRTNEWKFISIIYNSDDNSIKGYINGTLTELINTVNNNLNSDILSISSPQLVLGRDITGENFFSGGMDELRIWGDNLTAEQIRYYIQNGVEGNEEGLINYFNFDEASGTVIYDIANTGIEGINNEAQFIQGPYINNITALNNFNNSDVPEILKLFQNYPNPFNPSTLITYQLPKSLDKDLSFFVSLNIYSVVGEKIKTLVNDVQKSGTYSVNFDGSELTSGIYIYSLSAGGKVLSKKLILLK